MTDKVSWSSLVIGFTAGLVTMLVLFQPVPPWLNVIGIWVVAILVILLTWHKLAWHD